MNICPVGAELFHADGRTDMTTVIVAFRNFAKAPKNDIISCFGNACWFLRSVFLPNATEYAGGQMKLEILCYLIHMVQTRYSVLVLDLCQVARIHLT